MIVLACETSTLLGSVAIIENDKILAFEESPRQGSHSDVLNVFIERTLLKAQKKLTDIDVFASGIGPGSFTGIRISLNTVKTLAYCFNKPVLGINSLNVLAAQCSVFNSADNFSSLPIVAMINAYKNMVYIATYRTEKGELIETKSPEVIRVQNLESYITRKSVVSGDGFNTYVKYFSERLLENCVRIPDLPDEPHAQMLGLLAAKKTLVAHPWNQLLPLYLRASEAEENLLGIKFQPIL